MCHTVVAQRVCYFCNRDHGEIVVGFDPCARKCSSPFYRMTPTPELDICHSCAPPRRTTSVATTTTATTATTTASTTATNTTASSPVMSRNSSIDASENKAVSTAAAAAAAAAMPDVNSGPGIPGRRMS